MKTLALDAANTIIHKPELYINLHEVISTINNSIELSTIIYHHKLLSESISFPDNTNEEFYNYFNFKLLCTLGIEPKAELLNTLYKKLSNLKWELFTDVSEFNFDNLEVIIISNFNSRLKSILNSLLPNVLFNYIISEELGIQKKHSEFYPLALKTLNKPANDIIYIGDSFELDYYNSRLHGINSFLIDRENIYPNFANKISNFQEINKLLK